MKRTFLLAALASILTAVSATAQFADEAKFNERQADRLHDFAEKCFKKGFPRKAKRVWLQLLAEYDPDYAPAHEALGNAKVGKSWAPRSDFQYPKEDTPNASAANSLKNDWKKLSRTLGSEHAKLAKDYDAAGRADRARYHWERVIRYTPDDEKAKAALDHKPVEGLSGTDLERTLYDRSKLIEAAIAEQFRVEYPVEHLPDSDQSELLVRAQVPHKSVRSEHFICRGDFEIEIMEQAAEHAERAIRVVCQVFDGYPGFRTRLEAWPVQELLFVAGRETFQQVLDANAGTYVGDEKDFQFTRENAASATFQVEDRFVTVSNSRVESTVYDSAVRRVAQQCAGFGSTAMREGVGHTIVGMFFNQNQLFSIDRQRQIETSTEDEIEFNSPNFDEWKDLALEAAWKKTGTAAAELTLFQAHDFPNDARIKAWSFTDYLVRRDPGLARSLDGIRKGTGFHNPIDIEKKFTEVNGGLSISQLEKEWRDFWTEASPVLKAIRNNTPPLEAVSKDVKKWLAGLNEAREAFMAPPVTWSADYSVRCAEHAAYLREHRDQRGAGPEQSQDTTLEGATHLGNMFAQMALVETKAKKPDDTFEEWVKYPGYRDVLMNRRLWTVGMFVEKGMLVMEALRGIRSESKDQKRKVGYTCYPRDHKAVPSEVEVEELGPELEALLAKNGHEGKKKVGLPLSFHGFGTSLPGDRNSFRCALTDPKGNEVEGILDVSAAAGTNRHTSAPGMAVFYPLEPLGRGARYTVIWSFRKDNGDIERLSTHFTTK